MVEAVWRVLQAAYSEVGERNSEAVVRAEWRSPETRHSPQLAETMAAVAGLLMARQKKSQDQSTCRTAALRSVDESNHSREELGESHTKEGPKAPGYRQRSAKRNQSRSSWSRVTPSSTR